MLRKKVRSRNWLWKDTDARFSKNLKTDINMFKELKKKDVQVIKAKYTKMSKQIENDTRERKT